MPIVCRFKFPEDIKTEEIESQLAFAIISAECTFGPAKVRISASYYISKDKPQCAIDVSTEVGEHIAQVFTAMLTREFGEESFSVERVERRPASLLKRMLNRRNRPSKR